MKVKKEYKINEALFVTKSSLKALLEYYSGKYPKGIEKKVNNLFVELSREIEKHYVYDFDHCNVTYELIEKITCETKN